MINRKQLALNYFQRNANERKLEINTALKTLNISK